MSGTFGSRLKALRKERGLSQTALADLLGSSKQVVSRYETGQRVPKVDTVLHYASALGVPLSVLAGPDGDEDLAESEKLLLWLFRSAPEEMRELTLAALRAHQAGRTGSPE